MEIIITFLFMVLDVVTGFTACLVNKNYKSNKMRLGLYHKTGFILCIVFGILLDFSQSYIDLGVPVELPIIEVFCGYVIWNEFGSILENLHKINPEILPEKITGYFEKEVK